MADCTTTETPPLAHAVGARLDGRVMAHAPLLACRLAGRAPLPEQGHGALWTPPGRTCRRPAVACRPCAGCGPVQGPLRGMACRSLCTSRRKAQRMRFYDPGRYVVGGVKRPAHPKVRRRSRSDVDVHIADPAAAIHLAGGVLQRVGAARPINPAVVSEVTEAHCHLVSPSKRRGIQRLSENIEHHAPLCKW